MPNIPETAAAFLACASLGAVWSSCSPDFGARSVIDRFAQIEPKVLLAVRTYRYNGREFDRSEALTAIIGEMPGVQTAVLGEESWDALIAGEGALEFERVPFDHPLWVLYSSGTTGLPKAIVQSQGGILLEHLKMLHLHLDAQAGDRLFWFTTTGWMMWNFIVSGLLTEATVLLYDGSPGHPSLDVLWDFAARTRMTTFGTSASYIGACMKAGVEPAAGRDLSALKAVGSTGSPLSPEGFRWVYEHVGSDTWLFSTSGGTDLCTAFVGGTPLEPVYEGELQARALGAAIESWDPDGQAARRRGRRARAGRADAVDADLLLGRRGRLALPRGVLRHVPGCVAPRGLDRDHRARDGDHQRALGRDDQPRRHPHGHGRDLPRGAGRRRDRGRAGRRRPGRGRGRLDAAVRRAARGRRR